MSGLVPVLRATWALLLGIALLMLGYGLLSTLLGVRATMAGFPPAVTGAVMSGFYVGLLVGSFATPRLVARVGHVRVFAALLSVGSTAPLAHAVFVEPVAWFAIRLLTGYCFAGAFVVAESWLNVAGSNENRGTLLSAYMTVQLGALTLGQFLLDLADPGEATLFMLVSALVTVAAVPMLLTAAPAPVIQAPRGVSLIELYRLSPLGVVGVVGVGFSSGAIYGVGPVFARASGLDVALTSAFMAAIVAGGMVLQGPVGWVSDRFDRRGVIAAVTFLAALAAASSLALARPPAWWLFVQFFLVGGMALPMYALCAAHANDFLRKDQMVGASSALLLSYGIGAALGPTVAALCLQALGPAGYPLFLAAVHAGIGGFALWRMTRRPAVPAEDRVPHVAVATPSPVVTPIADALREAAMSDRAAVSDRAAAPAVAAPG